MKKIKLKKGKIFFGLVVVAIIITVFFQWAWCRLGTWDSDWNWVYGILFDKITDCYKCIRAEGQTGKGAFWGTHFQYQYSKAGWVACP